MKKHAGYIYSGQIAAYAYKAIEGKNYHTVIVISPSHREYFKGISVYSGEAYKTPIGIVEVDQEMRESLVASSQFIQPGTAGHRAEHALEVQLPFLQTVLGNFKIVPCVMGDQEWIYVDALAKAIAATAGEKTLVVASSDLSHFFSKEDADMLDSKVAMHINNFNYDLLQSDLESEKCHACGGGPIVAMMKAAYLKGFRHAEVVARGDSGDITGDNSEVVGYLSAVIY